jgi:hypothetical protein
MVYFGVKVLNKTQGIALEKINNSAFLAAQNT